MISTNSIIYLTCQNRPTKNRTTMLIGPAASLRRRPSESHGSILGVIRQSVFRRIEPRRSHCSKRLWRCYEALAQSGDSALTADVRRMNSIDTRASWRMAKVRRALYLLYLPARHGARRIGGGWRSCHVYWLPHGQICLSSTNRWPLKNHNTICPCLSNECRFPFDVLKPMTCALRENS